MFTVRAFESVVTVIEPPPTKPNVSLLLDATIGSSPPDAVTVLKIA